MRARLVLDVLRRRVAPQTACRQRGVALADLARWTFLFLEAGMARLDAEGPERTPRRPGVDATI